MKLNKQQITTLAYEIHDRLRKLNREKYEELKSDSNIIKGFNLWMEKNKLNEVMNMLEDGIITGFKTSKFGHFIIINEKQLFDSFLLENKLWKSDVNIGTNSIEKQIILESIVDDNSTTSVEELINKLVNKFK